MKNGIQILMVGRIEFTLNGRINEQSYDMNEQ